MATTAPTIRFDEAAIRRFSTSGISNRSGKSQQDGEEEDSDEDHAQDWSKETKDEESWANRERRRSSVWSKTDHNTPFANTDNAGRRGSILSLWSAGKDKDGKHILKHDDHEVKNDDESAISDGLASPNGSRSGSLSIPGSRRGTNDRSNSKGADRRPSILGMWSTGKDEEGNVVMLHDDEEWKK